MTVTEAAEGTTPTGKTVAVCGGLAIFGYVAQRELARLGVQTPPFKLMVNIPVFTHLPARTAPAAGTCTWPAIHHALFGEAILFPVGGEHQNNDAEAGLQLIGGDVPDRNDGLPSDADESGTAGDLH